MDRYPPSIQRPPLWIVSLTAANHINRIPGSAGMKTRNENGTFRHENEISRRLDHSAARPCDESFGTVVPKPQNHSRPNCTDPAPFSPRPPVKTGRFRTKASPVQK